MRKLLGVTREALKEYRTLVNNNKNESKSLSKRKLTRNIICGKLIDFEIVDGEKILQYGYGSLRIYVKDNIVVHIENRVNPRVWINKEAKDRFDIELGIKIEGFGSKIKRLLKVG